MCRTILLSYEGMILLHDDVVSRPVGANTGRTRVEVLLELFIPNGPRDWCESRGRWHRRRHPCADGCSPAWSVAFSAPIIRDYYESGEIHDGSRAAWAASPQARRGRERSTDSSANRLRTATSCGRYIVFSQIPHPYRQVSRTTIYYLL